jgi:ATP-dependent 26S proteasome regulatory subunit
VVRRTRLLDNEIRVLKDESTRLGLEQQGNKEKVKDNLDKIKLNRQLPYLVGNVVEVLDQVPEARRTPARRATLGHVCRVCRARAFQNELTTGPLVRLYSPRACARSPRRRRTAVTWTWTRSAPARRWC